jgi:flagellar biosynthesis chaperone FliJ
VRKKRWEVIYQTHSYDKYKDSNHQNIEMIFGPYDDLYIENLDSKKQKKLSEAEVHNYEQSIVWHPIQLERRIAEALNLR